MTTRELYLVVEAGDFTVGLQDGAPVDVRPLRQVVSLAASLGSLELAIRDRWPGRAFWIEQDLGEDARYQLVEYGAFANKPHKQVAR